MPEKITSIVTSIIFLAVVAVIFLNPTVVRVLGGTFVQALRTAATAGRR